MRNTHTQPPDFERRYFAADALELRRGDDGAATVTGYAAVFNELSLDLGGFRERIDRGAFAESLKAHDQRAYWNHNSDIVLGRKSAKTLRLAEDEKGLKFELDLPDTSSGRDAAVLIERGDVRQMSFGFRVANPKVDEELTTEDGVVIRTVKKVTLLEVSPVASAAYPQTEVALRSIEAWRQEQEAAGGEASDPLLSARLRQRAAEL